MFNKFLKKKSFSLLLGPTLYVEIIRRQHLIMAELINSFKTYVNKGISCTTEVEELFSFCLWCVLAWVAVSLNCAVRLVVLHF
jgi:hypothetical protein